MPGKHGFKVPEWGVFCHTVRLRNGPPRLKLVLPDSARARAHVFKAVTKSRRKGGYPAHESSHRAVDGEGSSRFRQYCPAS